MQLSKPQQEAVEHIGSPALVVAGAGSGKTRTLTAKIIWLIEKGYDPARILAITFTNKAADEMKTRLMKLTGMSYGEFPWVRTYHSACFMILKKHARLLGYELPLQVMSMYHQQKLLKEILVGMNIDKKHAGSVLSQISKAKNSGDAGQYFDFNPRMGAIRLEDVYRLYEKALKEMNAVDFDNILMQARNLLRDHKDVREAYQERFQYILVDEYQDSNDLQEELTRLLLGHGNLFCVGDDWQAIYGFRGSNVNHFLSFPKKYKNARVFRLEQNYRSADEIVQVANDIIGYNDDKMDKKCFSEKRGGLVETHHFYNDREEAAWVARKVLALHSHGGGLPLHQMAVVYRTKFSSLEFEKAFRAYRIPYNMLGAKGFFERKEILDINSYLAAAVFTRDDVSFERILNTPKRGIGPAMLKKIGQARQEGMSLQDATRQIVKERVMTPKIHTSLTELLVVLDDIRSHAPDAAIREIIKRINYLGHLEQYVKGKTMEYTSRVENIEQLIYSASQKETIADYLEEAALIREDKADDEEITDGKGGVNLLTIHSSKGLEYHTVFIVGCEEQLFPHWRSADSPSGLQEERRLMYVAMTRAEKFLYLTHADFRKGQTNPRSRFLDEIDECLR
jgi:DNA helicase-2/ATP-dependent DNA helicase PcrA